MRGVARVGGRGGHAHQAAVAVVGVSGADAFGDDAALGVAPQVNHLGASVGLLEVVGHGNGVELAAGVIPAQNHAGVLPGYGRAGFHLRPCNVRALARAQAALGDKVVDAATPLRVAGVPVLYGRVFDVRVVVCHQFHHGRVQLVLVALRRSAALQVAHVAAFLGNDERAFELPGVAGVDPKVRRKLHRAAHTLGDVNKRAVGEHGGIKRRIKVVAHRYHAAQVAFNQFRMVLHRVRERAEDHAHFGQLLTEGSTHRHGVKHRIHRHTSQPSAFVQRHAQLFISFQQLGVHLGQALGRVLQRLGCRVVAQGLKVDRVDAQ